MIKAATVTLYLSQLTIDLIEPQPTLSAAISRHLAQIAESLRSGFPTMQKTQAVTEFASEVSTLSLANNPNILDRRVTVILDNVTHTLLLRATLSNPALSLSAAVDGLLEASLKPIFSMISDETLIMEKIEAEPIPYGCLVPQYKNKEIYWLWRYPHRSGKQKDKYLGKGLDRAIAKVRAIGIPRDAAAKRLNKGKKLWAVSE